MKQAQPPDLVVVIATKLRENVDYNQQSSTLFESHFTYKKKTLIFKMILQIWKTIKTTNLLW